MHKITIKKPGKKTGNSYDLCVDCSQSLQSALVGDKPHVIQQVIHAQGVTIAPDVVQPVSAEGFTSTGSRRNELGAAELDENDLLLTEKGHTVAELNDEPPDDTFGDDGTYVPPQHTNTQEGQQCVHANRTGPKAGEINGKRTFYTRCRDCGAKLPMKTSQQKAAFVKGSTAGLDIRQGEAPTNGGK